MCLEESAPAEGRGRAKLQLSVICVELKNLDILFFSRREQWPEYSVRAEARRETQRNFRVAALPPFLRAGVQRMQVCTAYHTVSPCVPVANPLGNGGGIPVTMEMSKLACNKIST